MSFEHFPPMPDFPAGEIWLAGAGPGDPRLLTLLALHAVRSADDIVHDALVDPRVLALKRQDAQLIAAGKRGGKPTIRGMRMTVTDVLEYLASGMSEEEILADFPDLTPEDIKACLAFAADRERKLATLPEHETAV